MPMVMSLPVTSQVLTSAPLGSDVKVSDFALTSLEMWSFQVSKSPMSLSSADTSQVMNCSTLSFMSLRICWILLMSSLA